MLVHEQLKQRRKSLGLQQGDMKLRIGMNQQQFQRVEANGNPRLASLALIAQGLDAELVLVPTDKLAQVLAILEESAGIVPLSQPAAAAPVDQDPWAGVLGHSGQ